MNPESDKIEFHQTIQSDARWRRFDLYADDKLVATRTLSPYTLSSIHFHPESQGEVEWRLESYDIEYVPRGRFILKRTTTEEYEYDPAKLKATFLDEFAVFRASRLNHVYRHLSVRDFTEAEIWESFVIEKFEQHEGSVYGDELFGQIDVDAGVVLFNRSEDD